MSNLSIEFAPAIEAIGPDTWHGIAGTENPFVRYEFLSALEASGCVSARTGWQPGHVWIRRSGETLALAPCYIKTHSFGEYVFDWGWADAYQRHGLDYYPKLLLAVPFTPSSGPRVMVAEGADTGDIGEALRSALAEKCGQLNASSWHLLFPDPASLQLADSGGLLPRLGCQFRWFNEGYDSFDTFLGEMASRKRKNIRKERAAVREQGISFQWMTGTEIDDAALDRFLIFYQATYLKRGQHPYLNRDFFFRLRETMPEQLLLVLARKQGEAVAGALFLRNDQTLFGRYWGCLEEFDFLHFETCYYQGIDYCIAHRLAEFDAGAQGEHKLQRGFQPVITESRHWIAHPAFRAAIAEFVEEEAREVRHYAAVAREHLPFRRG